MVRKLVGGATTLVLLLAVVVAGVALTNRLAAKSGQPVFAAGIAPIVVLSSSMEPAYPIGSLLIVRKVDVRTIAVGHVITFTSARRQVVSDARLVTHRVVSVDRDASGLVFRTKGDANTTVDDSAVTGDSIIGSPWFAIPYLGYLVSFSHSKFGIVLLILVPSLLIVLVEVLHIVRGGAESE